MSATVTSSLSEGTQVNTSDPEGPKPGVRWASAGSVRTAAGSVALARGGVSLPDPLGK